jgi:hypothetical protein
MPKITGPREIFVRAALRDRPSAEKLLAGKYVLLDERGWRVLPTIRTRP